MKRGNFVQTSMILLCLVLKITYAYTQPVPVELVMGHKNYYYQHSFSSNISKHSPYGFFHTSSILIPFDEKRENEIMSQSYITYKITEAISSGIGTIYVPVSRLRPSAFLQFFKQGRRTTVLIFPRVDLWRKPSVELMGFVEYAPAINNKLRLYTRIQFMTTWTFPEHNRSYQYLRLGLGYDKFQVGIAANYDEYGKAKETYRNYGCFIRYVFSSFGYKG